MAKFHARIPNSTIMVQVGPGIVEQVAFKGHELDTSNENHVAPHLKKAVEVYLDEIADRPGSGISTKSHEDVDADVQAVQAAMRAEAEAAQTKMVKAGERV